MVSTVDICNRGLQKLGERKITSLDDDVKAARECKRAFDLVRDAVFRDHPWNSVMARASLPKLSDAPAWGFANQFQLPVDCLRVVEADTTDDWQVEGRRALSDAGAPLNILYVRQETDPAQYDLLLVEALASRLAAELAEVLTQSNTKKEAAERQYLDLLTRAPRRRAGRIGPAAQRQFLAGREELMPGIPILPGDVSAVGAAADPFGSLPPAQADGIRALEARDEGITRGLTVAEAWRDSVTELQQAEGLEDGAPAGFARDFFANADRGRSVALRSTPPGQRNVLDSDLQGLRADLGERAVTAEAAGLGLRRRLGLMQTLDTYVGGVTEDPGLFDSADGQINNLVETLGLPETRATALRTEMRTRLANAAVDGLMVDPAEAEAALRLGLYDDVLPKEIKQQRLAEAETQMQRARLLDGERRRQALSRRAAEGAADDTEIAAAQAEGSLSDTDAKRLRVQTIQAQQEAETRRARIDRVAGGDPLDPANEEDRQAADAYWEDVSEAYAFDDPAQQRQAELDLVRRIGVLPDGLAKKYRGMLLSRDPEIVVNGARAVTDLEETEARFTTTLPTEDLSKVRAISKFAALGLPADRAIELSEEEGEEEEVGEQRTSAVTDTGDEIVDNDQTDAPALGLDEGIGSPDEEDHELTDEEVDELLRRDGLAPIPRGGNPVDADGDTEVAPLTRFVAIQRNEELAFKQGTSPDSSRYERLGRLEIWDIGMAFTDASGELVRFNPNRHVTLFDPERGELTIYRRTEETDEGRVLSLGRLLGFGSSSNIFSVGARGAQIVTKGAKGVSTTLSSGIGPTGRRIDGPVSARTLDSDVGRAANQSRFDSIDTKTAADVNKTFPKNYDPLPYKPGTQVRIVRTNRTSTGDFVRVHGTGLQGSRKDGAWIIRNEDIRDSNGKLLSPSELKRRFALPHTPTHFSRVELPKGTTLRVGITNPPSRAGGGDVVQYQILGIHQKDWFNDTKFLGAGR